MVGAQSTQHRVGI